MTDDSTKPPSDPAPKAAPARPGPKGPPAHARFTSPKDQKRQMTASARQQANNAKNFNRNNSRGGR